MGRLEASNPSRNPFSLKFSTEVAGDFGTADDVTRDADEVERHSCPRCDVEPGSPCRSRSGAVAGTYDTGRFTKVARLAKRLRVQTPADRRPGQPWRPGTPPLAPVGPDRPAADIRIGRYHPPLRRGNMPGQHRSDPGGRPSS
ncbi:hypothetical protein GCM10010404_62380 [Nonomuraea africana]|uniref:DNA-binding phage zinc finger domain-containing protein n=1 Tax=Nonomuraea africana TaxID=46171 RepID=A0ABR9K682_9ACTN|nr:hypothetical protein [Nonomuraea africana]MBE1557527.1 hypothetical protein [Nonomuraea africana]